MVMDLKKNLFFSVAIIVLTVILFLLKHENAYMLKSKIVPEDTRNGNALGTEEQFNTNSFQVVTTSGDIVVYSAYFKNSSIADKNSVYIMALAVQPCNSKSCPTVNKTNCVFRYKDTMWFPEQTPVATAIVINGHHYKKYRPVILVCRLPDNRAPITVSITDLNSPTFTPLNQLTVSYNALNQTIKRNFTMCLSPIFGKPVSVENLVQYFEFNRVLGADYFIVYNHSLSDSQSNSVLEYYKQLGIVEIIPWNVPVWIDGPANVWYHAQLTMLNDCVYRNRGISRFVVTTDLDEFIIPFNKPSWLPMLSEIQPSCEYLIRSVLLKPKSHQNTNQGISVLTNRQRCRKIFEYKTRSKYIIRPNCVVSAGVHYVIRDDPSDNLIPRSLIPAEDALVYHYASPKRRFTRVGDSVEDNSLFKYNYELKNRTQTVLDNLDFKSGMLVL